MSTLFKHIKHFAKTGMSRLKWTLMSPSDNANWWAIREPHTPSIDGPPPLPPPLPPPTSPPPPTPQPPTPPPPRLSADARPYALALLFVFAYYAIPAAVSLTGRTLAALSSLLKLERTGKANSRLPKRIAVEVDDAMRHANSAQEAMLITRALEQVRAGPAQDEVPLETLKLVCKAYGLSTSGNGAQIRHRVANLVSIIAHQMPPDTIAMQAYPRRTAKGLVAKGRVTKGRVVTADTAPGRQRPRTGGGTTNPWIAFCSAKRAQAAVRGKVLTVQELSRQYRHASTGTKAR